MNEQDLAQKIGRRLDQDAANLDATTLSRLKALREEALAKYPATQAAYGLAANGGKLSHHHGRFGGMRLWAPLLALLLGLAAVMYWQATPRNVDNGSDIDSELLADDLPVHAYTNYIIEGWIRHASQ
ncbi:MAG: DUF3619 family protein [Pseudomonadota bacterium]